MPTYNFKNNATGEVRQMILSLSEREQLISEGEWTQMLSTPKFVTQTTGTLRQAGSGWKDVLGKVKKGAGKDNTIHD